LLLALLLFLAALPSTPAGGVPLVEGVAAGLLPKRAAFQMCCHSMDSSFLRSGLMR
jgi:hypothetical protein